MLGICAILSGLLPAYALAQGQPVPPINVATFTKAQFPTQFEVFTYVAESWRELGLDIQLVPYNYPSPFLNVRDDGRDFDIFASAFDSNTKRIDPQMNLDQMFDGDFANVTGAANTSGYNNPAYQQLIYAERQEYDVNIRRELVFQMQEILYEDKPALIVLHKYDQNAYNSRRFADPVLGPGFFMDPRAEMTIRPLTSDGIMRRGMQTTTMGSLNVFAPSPEAWQLRLLYDTLLRTGTDAQPELWMIESYNVVSPTTIEISLKDGLLWHDLQPVTTEDVAFTYNYLLQYTAPQYTIYLDGLKQATAISNKIVRFELEVPNSSFITQAMTQVPILPKHIWENVTEPEKMPGNTVIGSGPFKFDYVREGQESRMLAFKEHFFPPKIEGLLYIYYGTADAMYNALINQDVDIIEALLPHQVGELAQYDYLTVLVGPSLNVTGFWFNMRHGMPFSDKAFRTALSYAVPMNMIAEDIYLGLVTPGASLISPVNEFWYNPAIQPMPYDMEKARQILRDAGYTWDNNGRLRLPTN